MPRQRAFSCKERAPNVEREVAAAVDQYGDPRSREGRRDPLLDLFREVHADFLAVLDADVVAHRTKAATVHAPATESTVKVPKNPWTSFDVAPGLRSATSPTPAPATKPHTCAQTSV